MIRWSDTEISLVTFQSTMSCHMAVDDNDMSKTSDLVEIMNVGYFSWFMISRAELGMCYNREISLLLVSVLPHATWCKFAPQPTIIGILLTSGNATTAPSISLGGAQWIEKMIFQTLARCDYILSAIILIFYTLTSEIL
jgi:hypothetical protein